MRPPRCGEADSNEMGMYQDMFDKQIALTLSQHQDLGLCALLERQTRRRRRGRSRSPPTAGDRRCRRRPDSSPTPWMNRPRAPAPPARDRVRRRGAGHGAEPARFRENGAAGRSTAPPRRSASVPWACWRRPRSRPAGASAWRATPTAPSLNLFGIKADDSWRARAPPPTASNTAAASPTRDASAFRAYGSIAERVNDFAAAAAARRATAKWWRPAATRRPTWTSIGKSGYATDPQYANKLNEILHSSTFKRGRAQYGRPGRCRKAAPADSPWAGRRPRSGTSAEKSSCPTSLESASRRCRPFRQAIAVTSNNIANANTPGYADGNRETDRGGAADQWHGGHRRRRRCLLGISRAFSQADREPAPPRRAAWDS